MPRIKIKGLPKMGKYVLGGPNECPEGSSWDPSQQRCVPSIKGVQSFMTQMNYGNMGDINGMYPAVPQNPNSSTSSAPRKSVGTGNIWSNLATNLSNMANEDAKAGRLADQPFYNPFDVKWGQRQDPQVDITGSQSNTPFNQYATSSPASSFPMSTPGMLNLPQLVNTDLLSKDVNQSSKKKKKEANPLSGFDELNRGLAWTNVGIGALGSIVNQIDIRNRQKEFDEWTRQSRLPDNYYAVNTAQDRGDYDINEGMLRPNLLGFKSKGQFANPYYAQRNFVKYGGMMKAAEGIEIPGTQVVQQAFLPELSDITFPGAVSPSPVSSTPVSDLPPRGSSSVKLKGNDVATRTNNPGNLLYKPIFGKLFGAVDSGIKQVDGTGTFAAFPDVESGLKAREAQMFGAVDGTFKTKIYKPNITVDQALRKWSNNGYGGNIYPEIANKTLAQVTAEERKELLKRQIKAESGSMYKQLTRAGLLEEGGEFNKANNMKIRIVETPDEIQMAYGGQPPYSGQSGYGLYIGQRNLYRTNEKHPYDDFKNTVSEEQPTEDNPHVLEAEGGETIYRPDGTHMMINGDKHYAGGEKLTKEQAPEGSFIYSDTKRMAIKDPQILKMFGKGGGKPVTPASIAKQYKTNEYLAILQDPTADDMSKKTAKTMLDNYEKKLAELALVQEGMKGFPQGIPDVAKGMLMAAQGPMQGMEQSENEQPQEAKYGGGLRKFIDGGPEDPVNLLWNPMAQAQPYPQVPGPYDPNNPMPVIPEWYAPWLKSNTTKGGIGPKGLPTTFDPKNPNKFYSDYNYWKNLIGRDFTSPEDLQGSIYDYIEGKDPAALDKMWETWGLTAKGLKNPKDKRAAFVDKYFGARTADLLDYEVTTTTTLPPGEVLTTTTTTLPPGQLTTTTTTMYPGKEVPGGDPDSGSNPYGWTSQNIRDLANAAIDYSTLRKYHPYYSTVQPVLPEMVPVDWRGYAASLQSGANAAAQQLGTYQAGQSMAANLSQLAGQQAEGLGRYIGETDRANAAAATNLSAQRANILNQFTQYNAALRDKAGEEENVYDDRYRAAERLARKGIVKSLNEGEDVASKLYNENLTNSYYKVNPFTQRMKFNPQGGKAAWEAAIRGGYQDGTAMQNQGADIYNSTYERTKGTPEQKHDAALAAMRIYGGGGRESSTEYPYAPTKNRTTKTKTSKYGGSTKTGYSYYNPFLR